MFTSDCLKNFIFGKIKTSLGVYLNVISYVACSYVRNMVIRLSCVICTLVTLYPYRLLSNVCVPNTTVEPENQRRVSFYFQMKSSACHGLTDLSSLKSGKF